MDASSLDLGSSKWDILDDLKYAKGQITSGYSLTTMNPSFASTLSPLEDKNKEIMILNKIYEYRIAYPDIYDRLTVNFGKWKNVNTWAATLFNDFLNFNSPVDGIGMLMKKDKANISAGIYDYLSRDSSWYAQPIEIQYIKFLQTFKQTIEAYKKGNTGNISLILDQNNCDEVIQAKWFGENELSPIQIVSATIAMDAHELGEICPDKRAKAIAVILQRFIVSETFENAIYRLMTTCPDYDLPDFLTKLHEIKYNNNHVLGLIASAIDDETLFMGTNLNTMVMQFLAGAYAKIISKYSQSQFFTNNIAPVINVDPKNLEAKIKERVVTYNYVSFGKRLWKEIVKQTVLIPLTNADTKSTVEYNETSGLLKFRNIKVNGFMPEGIVSSKQFHPWEPIILDVQGNLLDNDKTQFVPAYLLYFAEKKANAKTTQAALQTAADAISLAIPGGQATLFLRILNYADKASSAFSIMGTITEENCPKCALVLNITSGILGVGSLTTGTLASKLNLIDNTAHAAENITKTLITEEKYADEVGKLSDKIIARSSEIVEIEQDAVARKKMIDILEREKRVADATNKTTISDKLNKAISKLKGIVKENVWETFYGKLNENAQKYFNGLQEDLKPIFQNDFINADETMLRQINQDNSEFLKTWNNYRKNKSFKGAIIICN